MKGIGAVDHRDVAAPCPSPTCATWPSKALRYAVIGDAPRR
jgi:hypothetical protein